MARSAYEQAYTSFGGVDIRAYFNNVSIGTLQAINFSVQREVAPLYVMGLTNPRSFTRGKRAIGGTMVFTIFDKQALLDEMSSLTKPNEQPYLNPLEAKVTAAAKAGDASGLNNAVRGLIQGAGAAPNQGTNYGWKVQQAAQYPDQLPPFDVVLTAQNEFGVVRTMSVLGCMLMEGRSGVSVDDLTLEEQVTYVARDISYWSKGQGGAER